MRFGLRSTEEIRKRGIDAPAQDLGPVGAIRFLQSFDLGRGDYTEERTTILDMELDDIVHEIEKRRTRETGMD